ncbi:retrovirus-related pol polyprotein from transposon TNT 1-94 [Tanacetum coccineum]
MFKDLKKFQAELDRYHDVNYASKMEIDCVKSKGDLMSYKMESQKSLNKHTRKINDLHQMISEMKKVLVAHQETISIMSQEKEAQNKFYKTREDKEIEKVISLENKVKVLDDIVYKTGQSVQIMNMLNRNCKTSFIKPKYLKKAQRANPRMYDIGCYNDNRALMLAPKSDETIRLAQESRSKLSDLIKPFDYENLNNLYHLFVPQREKSSEQRYFSERTKQPIVVPISTREPKQTVNQSATTPLKRIVAIESTNQKHRSTSRKQYEKIRKTSRRDNLFIVDSRCSKHITENVKLLSNFVEQFLGTMKFENDQIAPILGYGDLVQENVTIKRVYYVEGLNHNLFSVSSRGPDLYSITLQDTSTPNPICLMAKASSSQAWLWHRRLSHLYFDTINLLSKHDIVTCLPKLKFVKDHLCSSCELRKAKRKSFKTKNTPSSKRRLQILHMDLCGPMRVESFNGKKYVLVIVDDYSRYTRTYFLRSKDKTPEVLIDFLKLVQRGLHAQNHTLFEVARTMLSSAKVPLLFWAEAIATSSETVTTSNELDLLFGPMFDELLNGTTLVVSKSTAVTATDAPNQHKQQNITPSTSTTIVVDIPLLNIQTTPETTNQAPTQAPTITDIEIINQPETDKENAQVEEDKFINIFSTSVQEREETSTRRQLETNGEMCMFALSVSRTKPKNIKEAMANSAWIEAMQEEIYQFDRLDVWELVDRPLYKNVINMNWLLKNKRDEENTLSVIHCICALNTIILQLPEWTSDIILNVPLKEEVYINQPDRFVDPHYPIKVYRLKKAYMTQACLRAGTIKSPTSLCQRFSKGSIDPTLSTNPSPSGIFINQAKYAQEIVKKHGITSCDSIGTLMATKPLDADLSGTPVDQTKYRSMVGALMYLIASRPDIVHATCYCARYQARPTKKHLKEFKRIFWYLMNTINMGLWYLKDTGFELTAFLDSDYAGCLDSRKSTSGGIQFLGGDKLVNWSSKKQDCTSMSLAEAEYVSLSACCAPVLWLRTQLRDYGFHFDKIPMYCDSKTAIAILCNPVQYFRTKHIDVRYHFIKE